MVMSILPKYVKIKHTLFEKKFLVKSTLKCACRLNPTAAPKKIIQLKRKEANSLDHDKDIFKKALQKICASITTLMIIIMKLIINSIVLSNNFNIAFITFILSGREVYFSPA